MTSLRSTLQSFNEAIAQRQLLAGRCGKCETLFVPPRLLCAQCGATSMEPVSVSGRGELTAYSAMNIAPPWMAGLGYDRANPYISCVVKLREGPSMVGRLVVDEGGLDAVRIGLKVEVDFDAPLARPCLVFRLVDD